MQCLNCKATNSAANLFCEACGASLQSICHVCGTAIRIDSHFCGHCGSRLHTAAAPSSHGDPRSLSQGDGEYKRLTVLFADIQNSTGLVASLDPEEAMLRITPALNAMRDAVRRYDGLVNKIQGDGVMALFGAPRLQEDHAVRACLAALAMHDEVNRLGDPDVRIRIGVHTGEVVVQTVNSGLLQTYDAVGVAVHLANRLEQAANVGMTLISGATYSEAKQFVAVMPLGPRRIRGLSEPVDVYSLVGSKSPPASERFRSEPRLRRLIGRSLEIAALEGEFANTRRGDARAANVIGIVGEAGVGKSRLCFEFVEACSRQGARVYEARILAHGRSTPFQPVLELLRSAFGIRSGEPVEISRQRVTDLLGERGGFAESIPLLLEFLGLRDPSLPATKLDPASGKHRLLAFMRQFIRSAPSDESVVILLEDLHWIDEASEEFIEAIVDAAFGTRTMVVVNFRPGYVPPWSHRSHYRQVSLAPLADDEASELLGELMGGDASLASIASGIAERAQGNPFFLEELVRSVAEGGQFEGDRGAYRLKAGVEMVPLPATVQAVLGARIDRLPDSSRQVLQIAAVIGREVHTSILERVADMSSDEILKALSNLRRAELLLEMPPLDEGRHAFRHPLIQEVAYRSVLVSRRRELHKKVAAALSERFAAHLDEHSSLIAFHLEQAGELLEAARAHARAAIWVGPRDPRQALRSWIRARELLVDLPHSDTVGYFRMLACGQIVKFGWQEGISAEEGERYFEEAKQIALDTGNLQANAMLNMIFGRLLAVRGSADDYIARAREAVDLARQANDQSLEVVMSAGLSHALGLAGHLRQALELNVRSAARVHEVTNHHRQLAGFDVGPWLTSLRGQLMVMLGRFGEARPFLDRIIQMDPQDMNVVDHVMPSIWYVDLAWAERDVLLAERQAERAGTLAERSGNPYLITYATACRGLAHIVANRPAAAVERLTTAIDFANRRCAGLEYEPKMLATLALAYRLQGDLEAALGTSQKAIAVSAARHTRVGECLAHIARAQALKALKRRDEAADELARARELIGETGARLFAPLIRDLAANREAAD